MRTTNRSSIARSAAMLAALAITLLTGCSTMDDLGDELKSVGSHDTAAKGSVEGQGAARER